MRPKYNVMEQSENELKRDALVLKRHLRFIIGVLVVALLVAAGTGLIFGSGYSARATVQIQTNVVPLPTAIRQQDILNIARSEEVADEAARTYGVNDPDDIEDRVSVTERPEGLRVSANGGSRGDAIDLANSWAAAIETIINASDIGPASSAALERETANAATQLANAEAALAEANTTGIEPTQEVLDEVSKTLADNQAELASLTQATEIARQAVSNSNTPMSQLRIALAGLAVPPEVLASVENPQDLLQALDLRRQVLSSSVQQSIEQLNALQTQRRELLPLILDRDAAQNNYRESVRVLRASELGPITARISDPADRASGAGLGWPQRLGAAAAFGLVVGVIGAFALDALPPMQRWFKSPEEIKSRN